MDNYEKVREAIIKYREENQEDGSEIFYIVVNEKWGKFEGWCGDVWRVKIYVPDDKGWNDIFCLFDIDYDEGQEVEIIKVIPEYLHDEILMSYAGLESVI